MELEKVLEQGLADVKAEVKSNGSELKEFTTNEVKAVKEELINEVKSVRAELKEAREYAEKVQDHCDTLEGKMQGDRRGQMEKKSFNEVLRSSIEEAEDDYNKFLRKETKSFAIELKAVGDMSTSNVTGGSRYGQIMQPGIIELPKRKVHLSQILKGGPIGPGNTFTFMRENGQGEGAIAPVAEGAMKPQLDLDLIEATVNIETIAGWLRVTRKAMNNIPGFISFLQSRLPEKFQRVLDNQILYGDGSTPNLKGLLTSGNFVNSTSTAGVVIEKIIDDVSLLEDTYEREATGILLRPATYYSFFKNKATGSGEYDLPQGVTFVNGQMYLFGIPVYASTALNATDYVVGDFDMGAQLLTQEAMRIEFFEQDGTNVRENKVTVRIEGNYALPVYGSDYFIKGSTGATTTTTTL